MKKEATLIFGCNDGFVQIRVGTSSGKQLIYKFKPDEVDGIKRCVAKIRSKFNIFAQMCSSSWNFSEEEEVPRRYIAAIEKALNPPRQIVVEVTRKTIDLDLLEAEIKKSAGPQEVNPLLKLKERLAKEGTGFLYKKAPKHLLVMLMRFEIFVGLATAKPEIDCELPK